MAASVTAATAVEVLRRFAYLAEGDSVQDAEAAIHHFSRLPGKPRGPPD
jgi:hypothetical protein